MRRLGVVTGLRVELEVFARALDRGPAPDAAPILRCEGPGPEAARRAARTALGEGAEALLSFGMAGGLDPRLKPGTLVLASVIRSEDGETLPADPEWAGRLRARVGTIRRFVSAPLLSVERPVCLRAEKTALFRATGAAAVDLESYAVAEVAAEARVPFLALRAVADRAKRTVPQAAIAALAEDGGVAWGPLALALAMRPWESIALMGLASESRTAQRGLGRFVRRALPGFGL